MQHLVQKCSSVAHISADRKKGVCREDNAGCGQTWKKDVFLFLQSPTDEGVTVSLYWLVMINSIFMSKITFIILL